MADNLIQICNFKVIFSSFLAILSVSIAGIFVTNSGISQYVRRNDGVATSYGAARNILNVGKIVIKKP